jgi:putative copper resistance protein D
VTLLVKLFLFALMLGLAAANRYRLTPALSRVMTDSAGAAAPLSALRASVVAETGLGLAVLACVAWLGTLPPPAAG